MLLAATTQQSVALVILLVIAVGGLIWILGVVRRGRAEIGAELELAPNRRPYLSDDELESKKLERTQLFGLGCLVLIAVGLPLYWLGEPGRHEGAISNFDETFASRGEALFATTEEGGFNCAGCHGGLDGGTAPYTITDPETGKPLRQVQWDAPALRDVALRMTEDQLREVLVYGRPFSPMPAWGLEGGGPMNEQQIDNLIAYLKRAAGVAPYEGARENVAQAKEDAEEAAQTELSRLRGLERSLSAARAKLASPGPDDDVDELEQEVADLEAEIALGQDRTYGAALFNVNCARCHTLGYSYGNPEEPGGGAFGPSLYNSVEQFPLVDDHVDFVTNGRQFGEKYGRQGKASGRMPYFGQVLTPEQIDAIVAYERSLATRRGAR